MWLKLHEWLAWCLVRWLLRCATTFHWTRVATALHELLEEGE